MNPCDHPHGGGNGKTSPPTPPRTPWGKYTKWSHTKKKKIDKLNRRLFRKIR
jgi:large subunit ribosomal protein L2